jgi:GTP pyrophosphokinase
MTTVDHGLPTTIEELAAFVDPERVFQAEEFATIWKAWRFAQERHSGQRRESGEPFAAHPLAVAKIVNEYIAEVNTIAAAFLHDLVEDGGATMDEIGKAFSADIAQLVDGVSKLAGLSDMPKQQRDARNFRKLFMAMVSDPRVIILKLADRLHNIRTLDSLEPERRKKIAQETLDIFAPLAEIFGIWEIKREFEDRSFQVLDPENYEQIRQGVRHNNEERGAIIEQLVQEVTELLRRGGYPVEKFQIQGRPKHLYSIYKKLQAPKYRGHGVERVYDKLGIRVIVENKEQCYGVLGLIHGHWPIIPGEFDDFISMQLPSGYQSLHTAIRFGPNANDVLEFQIRTAAMHEVAEHGIAAHWRYKDGYQQKAPNYEAKLEWLRSLTLSLLEDDPNDFVAEIRSEVFESQIVVLSPKGKIIDLPEGSTPVDFAYHIHSEVGNKCIGAKVNGKIVSLDYRLQNGEIVDIMTAKSNKGPSRDWLNFVKTPSARSHIKRFFRRAEREENVAAGRDLLEKELKRHGLTASFDSLVELMGAKSIEDMFAQIGAGDLTARTVAQRALAQQAEQQQQEAPPLDLPPAPVTARNQPVGVQVTGVGAVHNRLAKCCNPVVGEPIVGFVTRGRGITVHRADCRTILNERDSNRLIDVLWGGQQPKGYPVPIRIESWDRVGLWRDISNIIADAGINIEKVEQGQTRRAGRTVLHVVLQLQSVSQLSNILDRLNRIKDVIEARRESGGAGS